MKDPLIAQLGPELATIEAAFDEYVKAYANLETLQKNSNLLPGGDQKTGVVGEYYALLFALGTFKAASITLMPNSQKAMDIKVGQEPNPTRIQVKTISAFSKTGKISSIKERGWELLYILHFDELFQPNGFWVVTPQDIHESATSKHLNEVYGPRPDKPRTAGKINFHENRLEELLAGIKKGRERLRDSQETSIKQLLELKQVPAKKKRISKKKAL